MSIFKNNFCFKASRYEEWQAGRMISSGRINTEIIATCSMDSIHFELDNVGEIRMIKSFDFNFAGSYILSDRIQYIRGTMDFNPVVPIICHIFNSGDYINYVRFAMTNPDRIVEFYR